MGGVQARHRRVGVFNLVHTRARARDFEDTPTLYPTNNFIYNACRAPFPLYASTSIPHPRFPHSSSLPPPTYPPVRPPSVGILLRGCFHPRRICWRLSIPRPPSPSSSLCPTAAEIAGVTAAETPDPVATDAAAASAGVSAAGSTQLSSRQRNRLKREARAGAAASAGAPPFVAKAKRRRGGGGEDGKGAGGNGGGDSGGGSGGGGGGGSGGASEREDGPPAFLGRARGMMDVAGDARGALVSLAADLVAQVW